MTEDQQEALELIRTQHVYGDGHKFRYCGRDISTGVRWAIELNYAHHSQDGLGQAVTLSKSGKEAVKAIILARRGREQGNEKGSTKDGRAEPLGTSAEAGAGTVTTTPTIDS
jgi:hypothetical protein